VITALGSVNCTAGPVRLGLVTPVPFNVAMIFQGALAGLVGCCTVPLAGTVSPTCV
jgi:hypothetical protein